MKVIPILSGGLDSATLLYRYALEAEVPFALSFDYGQRHHTELRSAHVLCLARGIRHEIVEIRGLSRLFKRSALTDDAVAVPEGHYSDESMKATIVPNRNAIMLSIAVAAAITESADAVAIGVHAGDHPIYPDCRPEFIEAFTVAMRWANVGSVPDRFNVLAPFSNMTKDAIVRLGTGLGVPYEHTWSCYKGGKVHCGKCGTCVERREAFTLAGVADPTIYEDQGVPA